MTLSKHSLHHLLEVVGGGAVSLHVALHFQSSALSFTVFISFAMSPLPLNMPASNGCIPRSGLVLPVCVAQPDGVALSPSPNSCRARCFRGTPPRTPQTKTKMMVVRTSAPCRRSSLTTARRAGAELKRIWERRVWTSRAAKWATLDTKAARLTA